MLDPTRFARLSLLCLLPLSACSDESAAPSAWQPPSDVGGPPPDTITPSSDTGWAPSDTSRPSDATSPTAPPPPQDAWSTADTSPGAPDAGPEQGNTHINLGGAQDFGYVRALIEAGRVPHPSDLDPAGFFAEHSTPLPAPTCGERMCVQAMLGVMGNLLNGRNCTMIQLGLNSPIVVDESDRPPLTLAVVIDVSGSMQDDGKMEYVRRGLERLVVELHDDDQLALVTYSATASRLWPMRPVRGNRSQLLALVRGLAANGATNLYDGLRLGYDEVTSAYDSGRQNRVILLSDGEPTAGITDHDAILGMSSARNSDGIGLTTVGLGVAFNLELMQGLAELADGNFYFLESATAVDEVFSEELAYFTVPVAFDVELDVRSGTFYDLVRVSGTKRFALDEGGGSLSVPSVFFAHRTSHDDVFPGEDGTGRRGGGSMLLVEMMPRVWDGEAPPSAADVAHITLSYREPGTDRVVSDEVTVHYPHAPDEILATGFFDNAIVTKSFVVLNLYFAIEQAALLFHGGDARAARDLLHLVMAAAADYEDSANDGEGDLDIRLDLELLGDLADLIGTLARLDVPPPAPPENPWPCD